MTGLSGSGKTHAVKVLEDIGYYTLDNVPPALIPEALAVCERGGYDRVAFVIDVRSGPLFQEAIAVLDRLDSDGRRPHLLFFDAADDVLLRRYSETRHRHPLEGEGENADGVAASIVEERRLLEPLRVRAAKVIDTTHLSVTDLRQTMHSLYGAGTAAMLIRVTSFGYKHGLPPDADIVLDCRFMENPFYIDELRPLTGGDKRVREFVLGNPATEGFIKETVDLLRFALPRYEAEKKAYLTIAFGCTGGRHRSVVVAEEVARRLGEFWRGTITVGHRDVERQDGR